MGIRIHWYYKGNEKANELARKGTSETAIQPRSFCGIPLKVIKTHHLSKMLNKGAQNHLNKPRGCRQAIRSFWLDFQEMWQNGFCSVPKVVLSHFWKIRLIVGSADRSQQVKKNTFTNKASYETIYAGYVTLRQKLAVNILYKCESLARSRRHYIWI